jgi:hypothetical protein
MREAGSVTAATCSALNRHEHRCQRFKPPEYRLWGGRVELWDLVWATRGLERSIVGAPVPFVIVHVGLEQAFRSAPARLANSEPVHAGTCN